jgi:hypothetical protein
MKHSISIALFTASIFLNAHPSVAICKNSNDWKHSLDGEIARCFHLKDTKFWCDEHVERGKLITAELQIETLDPYFGQRHAYGYGKSIDGTLCREHLRKIRKLTLKVDQVCIAGVGEVRFDTGEIYARFRGLETKRGCVRW